MTPTKVEYQHDGDTLVGQIAFPAGDGPHPAVLVMHDARGLGGIAIERLSRLTALGYVAFASDMYGGGQYSPDSSDQGALMFSIAKDPKRMRDRVVASFEYLRDRPEVDASRVAAIGFCFGGQCVLELARSGADAKAVVSYHGLLTTEAPARSGEVKAEIAVYTGGKDPYAPPEHVAGFEAEMKAAGAPYQLTLFSEAYHAFTDPDCKIMKIVPGIEYDPMADRMSWAGTVELLKAAIGE